MAVQLISQPNTVYTGGVIRNYNTVNEAKDQALSDISVGYEPAPDRIVDEDGSILFDRSQLAELAE